MLTPSSVPLTQDSAAPTPATLTRTLDAIRLNPPERTAQNAMDTKSPSDVAPSDLHKAVDLSSLSGVPVSNRRLTQPSPSGYKDSFEVSPRTAGDVGLPVSAGFSASAKPGLICWLQGADVLHTSGRWEAHQATGFAQTLPGSSRSRARPQSLDDQLNTGIPAHNRTTVQIPRSDTSTETGPQRTAPLLSIHASPKKDDLPPYVADAEEETPEPQEDFLA